MLAVISSVSESQHAAQQRNSSAILASDHTKMPLLMLIAITVTNSAIQLGSKTFKKTMFRKQQIPPHQINQKIALSNLTAALPTAMKSEQIRHVVTNPHIHLSRPSGVFNDGKHHPAALTHVRHVQEMWRFNYNDEWMFYFGYCISFPGGYQDYPDPPD